MEYTDDQFSDAALAILQSAAEECRSSGSERISSEHLLLALTIDASNKAGQLLQAQGLKVDALRKEAKEFASPKSSPTAAAHDHAHGHAHGHAHEHKHDSVSDSYSDSETLTFSALGKWILTGAIELAAEA